MNDDPYKLKWRPFWGCNRFLLWRGFSTARNRQARPHKTGLPRWQLWRAIQTMKPHPTNR